MGREFLMPSLGADMEAGTLVKWCVQPGSRVRRGDIVALVETEKGIIDIESFEDGVVERLTVQPGTRVPVGTPLAVFASEPAAATAERAAPATAAPAAGSAAPTAGGATPVAAVTGAVERAARRMPRTSPA